MAYTAVFGGIFVDIKGFPFDHYLPTGRNVGDVRIVHGGVCRNVAQNMANVDSDVSLVTMFEPDGMGEEVRRCLAARGVDLFYAVTAPAGMGMWLAVFDEHGDLAGSISRQPDFSALEAQIDARGDEIVKDCSSVVLEIDMNAPIAEKVLNLAEKYGKDVYVVVGNMSVILKHPEYLSRIRLLIVNEGEAERLFGCKVERCNPEQVIVEAKKGAAKLGIREIVVTLGDCGAVYWDSVSGDEGFVPAEQARMVDCTGAGDAFFSGTVAARVRGASLGKAAKLGAHLAALTIGSDESTCPRVADFWDED